MVLGLRWPTFCIQTSQYIVCVEWEEPPVIEQHRQQLGHCRAAGKGEGVLAVREGECMHNREYGHAASA